MRSRLFLEGNYFVELQPGHAGLARAGQRRHDAAQPDGAPVQFNQVLTALQSETREDLRTLPARVLAAR